MWSIEHSYVHNIELCGIVADVQKAFNFLSRTVVTEVLAWIGIPVQVLVGWTGAVQAFARRFQVNGGLSQPLTSVTGYPEGDALSCLAMVAVDMVFHAWHVHFFPLCQPITYVDDWQLVSCSPEGLIPLFECLHQFSEQMDLSLDYKKTYMWCISARGRALLRAAGFHLEPNGRNLGAHVQFTKQHANKILTDRIASVAELWGRLRRSHSRHTQKVIAVRVAAWPRALHAVASTALGANWFQQLRSGAMKGLALDAAGANSHVQLGLVELPETDPEFWALLQTLRLARDCGQHKAIQQNLRAVAHGDLVPPANGITATLLHRLQGLSWHIDEQGRVHDQFGSFSLFTTSMVEIRLRAAHAWKLVVAAEVAHRSGFDSLERCDPVHTRRWLHGLTASDRALAFKSLNGTHITQDGLRYCQQAPDDTCQFCGCSDSRYHRYWICPHFAHCRLQVPNDVWDLIPGLPDFLTGYGWSISASTTREWYKILAALPTPPLPQLQSSADVLHLFTDGSCINQANVDCRFASWSVISASVDASPSEVFDTGLLPGMLQNAYRAEVFAVLRAVQCARRLQKRAMLWTDCEGVLKRVRRLLQGQPPRVNSPNYDLWKQLFQEFLDASPGQFAITQVAAHRDTADAGLFEEWCFRHNQWADRTAVRTNFSRPSWFWDFCSKHFRRVSAAQYISRHVQTVIISVGRAAVAQDAGDVEGDGPEVPLPPAVQFWHENPVVRFLPDDAVRWYPRCLVRQVLSWFLQTTYASTHEVIWVSQAQLYLDFQMATGSAGPVKLGSWLNGDGVSPLELAAHPFRVRVRWFARVLKETLKKCGISISCMYGLPCSNALKFHTGTLAVPWPRHHIDAIDRWILRHLPQGVRRISKALDRLPIAGKDPAFDDIFISCM